MVDARRVSLLSTERRARIDGGARDSQGQGEGKGQAKYRGAGGLHACMVPAPAARHVRRRRKRGGV